MSEVVNLNKARKAKLKQMKSVKASENRVIYGVSTRVRKLEKVQAEKEGEKWAGKLLNPSDDNKKG